MEARRNSETDSLRQEFQRMFDAQEKQRKQDTIAKNDYLKWKHFLNIFGFMGGECSSVIISASFFYLSIT
jgi:hypothetical protein